MNQVNETLRQALVTAQTSPQKALDALDAGLEKARELGDSLAVSLLAKHAGVLATELGDLTRALRYYNESSTTNPKDAYVHFALGDVHRRLGQIDEARAAFKQSLKLATEQADHDMIQMASDALSSGGPGT